MDLKTIFGAIRFPLVLLFVLSLANFGVGYYAALMQFGPSEQVDFGLLGLLSLVSLALVIAGWLAIIFCGYKAGKATGSTVAGAVGGILISVITGIVFGILNLVFIIPLASSAIAGTQEAQDLTALANTVGLIGIGLGIAVNAIIGLILGAIGGFIGKKKSSTQTQPAGSKNRPEKIQYYSPAEQDQNKFVPKLEKLRETQPIPETLELKESWPEPDFVPHTPLFSVLSEEEKEQVNQLVALLEEDKQGFSAEQVKKVIFAKGYSQAVVEEVIRRLYG